MHSRLYISFFKWVVANEEKILKVKCGWWGESSLQKINYWSERKLRVRILRVIFFLRKAETLLYKNKKINKAGIVFCICFAYKKVDFL